MERMPDIIVSDMIEGVWYCPIGIYQGGGKTFVD